MTKNRAGVATVCKHVISEKMLCHLVLLTGVMEIEFQFLTRKMCCCLVGLIVKKEYAFSYEVLLAKLVCQLFCDNINVDMNLFCDNKKKVCLSTFFSINCTSFTNWTRTILFKKPHYQTSLSTRQRFLE